MKQPALSLIIPVYNSEATLPKLVEQISSMSIPDGHELILVNDGSRDASWSICQELLEITDIPLTVINLSRNFGEHNAVMAGLHHANGRHVVIMDDDFQNPLSEIMRLLTHAQQTGSDAVYTYYAHKHHSMWRNAGSWLANRAADLLLDKPHGLYLSSFKCLSAFTAAQIIQYKGPFPYIDGLIFQVSQSVESIQVEHAERDTGTSNYSVRKLLRLGLILAVNFSVMPLRMATMLGFLLAALGFLFAVQVIIEATFFHTPLGWGSLMAALLVFSGIQLIMLGVMGEYLGKMHLTLNEKPQFIVRSLQKKIST